jgi:hypothetical protein
LPQKRAGKKLKKMKMIESANHARTFKLSKKLVSKEKETDLINDIDSSVEHPICRQV